jgi:hypothetical protein
MTFHFLMNRHEIFLCNDFAGIVFNNNNWNLEGKINQKSAGFGFLVCKQTVVEDHFGHL